MKKPSKKPLSTSISVSEFKSWMSGVEDMQEDDWVPNKQQWERIKSKIELLADDVVTYVANYAPSTDIKPVEQFESQRIQTNTPMYTGQEQTYVGATHRYDYSPQPEAFFNPTPLVVNDQNLSYANGDSPDFL